MNTVPSCTPSFALVVPTVYGLMILNRHDINQTNALVKLGRAIDHDEIVLLQTIARLLGDDFEFLDIGANFGTYTLGLAPLAPRGKVHAFEPQRIIHHMLAGSVALNGLTHVHCHNLAVGKTEGRIEVPQFNYTEPMNFGSVEFLPEQTEPLSQTRSHDPDKVEHVGLVTIDGFGFKRARMMKIDVEGMEMDVLDGATETIRRCRPVMLVEFIKADMEALHQRIAGFGYGIHESRGNFLCIPNELSGRIHVSRGG